MLISFMLISSTLWAFVTLFSVSKGHEDCNDIIPDSTLGNILLFIVIRALSHYSLMSACLYVFWASRRKERIDIDAGRSSVLSPSSGNSFPSRVINYSE